MRVQKHFYFCVFLQTFSLAVHLADNLKCYLNRAFPSCRVVFVAGSLLWRRQCSAGEPQRREEGTEHFCESDCWHFFGLFSFYPLNFGNKCIFHFARTSQILQRILPCSWLPKNTRIRFVKMTRTAGKKLLCRTEPISLLRFFFYSFLRPDGHQWELPGHVGHHLQSLTPPASCDTHQDRLEQDPELQDWQRDAEQLERKNKK